ncbi:MAG TPA: biopolymer transporter ExbD [Tepidisphaeraceae bacterium]|jgi:biopolymer transport protein ExbD
MNEDVVNVTPLIDVVMCLIIFFMLVAKIGVDTGVDRTIAVPASILGTDIKQMDIPNALTLNVKPGLGDQPDVAALLQGSMTELKLNDGRGHNPLADSLKFFRYGKDLAPGGWGVNADNPAFNVNIRGDKSMDYRYLEPVLLACAEANVKSVNFSTEQVVVHQ